jgi:hypothetical protein
VPSWSWLLVLVLGGWRVGLSGIACKGPALGMGQLVLKDSHGQVQDLGAADRAAVGLLLVQSAQLGDNKFSFPQGVDKSISRAVTKA